MDIRLRARQCIDDSLGWLLQGLDAAHHPCKA